DADERLAQMSAILGGRTFDRRHAIKATVPRDEPAQWVAEKLSPSGAEDATAHRHNSGNPQLRKRTVEEKEGEDSHNTRG
ncbi:MAG TPA: hypothetical protein VE398_13395, partial [Acidobacteriota bacterium]|nr:hypothetical protein [Acidobacteriota bacterium]